MNKIVNKELALLLLEKEYPQEQNIGDIFRITNKINPLYEKIRELDEDDLSNEWSIINEKYPLLCDVIMWLYEKHSIWITVTSISQESWQYHITKPGDVLGKLYDEDFYNPTETYEGAVLYVVKNLI